MPSARCRRRFTPLSQGHYHPRPVLTAGIARRGAYFFGSIGAAVFSAGAGGSTAGAPSRCACASGRAGCGAGVVGRSPPGLDSAGAVLSFDVGGEDCSGGVPCAMSDLESDLLFGALTCGSGCGSRALNAVSERPDITRPVATIVDANSSSLRYLFLSSEIMFPPIDCLQWQRSEWSNVPSGGTAGSMG